MTVNIFCALRYRAGTGSFERPVHPLRLLTKRVYFRIVKGSRAKLRNLAAATVIYKNIVASSLFIGQQAIAAAIFVIP